VDCGGVDGRGKSVVVESARGGSENNPARALAIEERLHAETIANETEPARGIIPNSEGKHATQARYQFVDAPGAIALYQYFGVGAGVEPVAVAFQLGAQLEKIVNSAIEHHTDGAIRGEHGLAAGVA